MAGHTNAGKTSLLRTLTRQRDFGAVSDNPGTTRNTQTTTLRVDGRVAVRFLDTPGLEDSVALLRFLRTLPGDSPTARVRAFLQGPEARATFEQEAKVLRALIEHADAALLVIDTRAPVLPKYRAELEILGWCTRPIMPVLNFVRAPGNRSAEWEQALQESNLHVRVGFDAVAPLHGAESRLYRDMGVLLPAWRKALEDIASGLEAEARDRLAAASRVMADHLITVAAMRQTLLDDAPDSALSAFRSDVARAARRASTELLELYGFHADDAEITDLPDIAGRWEDDLFNPELLKATGARLGTGALIGASVGAVADVALAGLSFGAATAAGATVGGALSGGWRPLWKKLENRLSGIRELTVEDDVLRLLAMRLCTLTCALAGRGHAALAPLRVGDAPEEAAAPRSWHTVIAALDTARGHPEWEKRRHLLRTDEGRAQLQERVARLLAPQLSAAEPPITAPTSAA